MAAQKKSISKVKKVSILGVKDTGKVENVKHPKRLRKRAKKKLTGKLIRNMKASAPSILKESPTIKKSDLVNLVTRKGRLATKKTEEISHTLDSSQVTQAVSELLRLDEERKKSRKELFDTEGDAVFLTIASSRIANVPKRIVRFDLPHPLVQETTDIALIVRDLQPREKKPDMDAVIQLHESRLLTQGVTRPIKVIPIRQIMTENKTYESKRRFGDQFNVILADTHICSRLYPILGKTFSKRRLNPIPVKLDDPSKYKHVIERALGKTGLKISADGGTTAVQVGHTAQKPSDITENILRVAEGLSKHFPGGWMNIRNLIIKTSLSPGLPLYVAICDPSDINLVGLGDHPKRDNKAVEGDLSTKMETRVRVYPSGRVISVQPVKKSLKKKKRNRSKTRKNVKEESDDEMGEDSDEEEELDSGEEENEQDYLSVFSNSKQNLKRPGKPVRSIKKSKKN